MSKKILLISFFVVLGLLVLVLSGSTYAQDKKSDLKKKLDGIKGDVEKIVITADGNETVVTGEDAKKLFHKIKSSSESRSHVLIKKFVDEDGATVTEDEHGFDVWVSDEDEFLLDDSDGIKKMIKVEKEGDKTKVVETITENGEKKEKVYEGEEAEKYLKEMEEELDVSVFSFEEKDGDFIILKGDKMMLKEGEKGKTIKVKVKKEDGKKLKKIIIEKENKK